MELLPTRGFGTLQRQVNRLFEDFFGEGDVGPRVGWAPALDIAETDDEVTVMAEVPGVDPGELELTVTGNVLTLSGEKQHEAQEKAGNYQLVERRYGAFRRSITLPSTVDPDRVAASSRNGVLTVRIGKREETKPRAIEVKTEE